MRDSYIGCVANIVRQIGTFTTNPIQFRIRDTSTVYLIDTTIKKYTYFARAYSLQSPGAELSGITAKFLYFDISADSQLLVFMLDDLTLNTLTYNPTSKFFQNKKQIGTAKSTTTNITISNDKKIIAVSGT